MGERDLNYLKTTELVAGSAAAVAGDKFIMLDVSDGQNPVVRTIQDILDLIEAADFDNPMTTLGDLIVGGASGAGSRLAIADASNVLQGGSTPAWNSGVFSKQVEVTLAELNAGKTIIPAVTGKSIVVLDFNVVCDGAFAALDSAELEDASATVNVCSLAQANMTDNAVLFKGATGVTPGAGLAEALTVSEALVISKTGSDATTATKLTVAVSYMLVG